MTERTPTFTELAIGEITSAPRKNQCCRRAFLFGILLGAGKFSFDRIEVRVRTEELASYLKKTVREQFGRDADVFSINEKKAQYGLSFSSRKAAEMMQNADAEYDAVMKCQTCLSSFLGGVFCASASVNDPQKDYYLSMRIPSEYKDTVSRALSEADVKASCRMVSGKYVFYIRSSERIEDLLALCGAARLLFDFMNRKIEKDIRNNANRTRNFEINNIKKSVGAAQKYIDAITWLEENDRLLGLESELYETAKLRVEYPDYSLGQLGAMANPAVSKSGVTHRLNKIYAIYEKAKNKI